MERAFVAPPGTRIGPVTAQEREKLIKSSPVTGIYDKAEDRESAYEKLTQRVAEKAPPVATTPETRKPAAAAGGGFLEALGGLLGGSTGPRGGRREGAVEAATRSAARAIGSQVGREIVRGVLGSLLGGGKRRR